MTRTEAQQIADRYNAKPNYRAAVVRILPPDIDPPSDNDNGWDVEITALDED